MSGAQISNLKLNIGCGAWFAMALIIAVVVGRCDNKCNNARELQESYRQISVEVFRKKTDCTGAFNPDACETHNRRKKLAIQDALALDTNDFADLDEECGTMLARLSERNKILGLEALQSY